MSKLWREKRKSFLAFFVVEKIEIAVQIKEWGKVNFHSGWQKYPENPVKLNWHIWLEMTFMRIYAGNKGRIRHWYTSRMTYTLAFIHRYIKYRKLLWSTHLDASKTRSAGKNLWFLTLIMSPTLMCRHFIHCHKPSLSTSTSRLFMSSSALWRFCRKIMVRIVK